MCLCEHVYEPRVDTMMDDEDEQINTKGLSWRLHPNLTRHVCAVSQKKGTADGWERDGKMTRPWGEGEG